MKPDLYIFLLCCLSILTCMSCRKGENREAHSIKSTNVVYEGNILENQVHLSSFRAPIGATLESAEDTVSRIRYILDIRVLPKVIDSICYFYFGPKLLKGVTEPLDSVKLYLQNGNVNTLAPRNHDGMDFPYFLAGLSLEYFDLLFNDFNYDLNEDIAITTWASGASGNTVNDIYLFNDNTGEFEFSSALSGLASIYLNPKRKLIGERPNGGGFEKSMIEYRFENDNLILQSSLEDNEINIAGDFRVVRDVYHLIDGKAITFSDTFTWFSVAQDPSDFQSPWKSIGHIRWIRSKGTKSSKLFYPLSVLDTIQEYGFSRGYLYTSPLTGKEIYLRDVLTNNKLTGVKAYELDNDNHLRERFIEIYSYNSKEILSSETSMAGKTKVYEDFDSIVYIFFDSRSSINLEGNIVQCNHPVTYNLSTSRFE